MPKPKFNPNQPFSEGVEDKPKFDPNLPFSEGGEEEEPKTPAIKTIATGLAEGGTFGAAPYIGAAGRAFMNAATGVTSPDQYLDDYRRERDTLRKDFKKSADDNRGLSIASNILGGGGPMKALGKAALSVPGMLGTGAVQGLSASDADLTKGEVGRAALDTTIGAGASYLGGKAVEKAAPYVKSAALGVKDYLRNKAAALTENATGATAAFMENKFPEMAGRKLLRGKHVRFGDSPANIAERAQQTMANAEVQKEHILNTVLANETGDRRPIIDKLRARAAALLKEDGGEQEAKAFNDAADELERVLPPKAPGPVPDELYPDVRGEFQGSIPFPDKFPKNNSGMSEVVTGAKPGVEPLPVLPETTPIAGSQIALPMSAARDDTGRVSLSVADRIRRKFDKLSKWDILTPTANRNAYKEKAGLYRDLVEEGATAFDPAVGKQFKDAKSVQSLLIPIEEAARRRAATTSQSPIGGLLDTAQVMTGGPVAPIASRLARSRISSSAGVLADKMANGLVRSTRSFGKFRPLIESAVRRGPEAVAAVDRMLSQSSPEYLEAKEAAINGGQ